MSFIVACHFILLLLLLLLLPVRCWLLLKSPLRCNQLLNAIEATALFHSLSPPLEGQRCRQTKAITLETFQWSVRQSVSQSNAAAVDYKLPAGDVCLCLCLWLGLFPQPASLAGCLPGCLVASANPCGGIGSADVLLWPCSWMPATVINIVFTG